MQPNNANMLQSIRGNIAALQRQWVVISSQPDGPTKTNAQQHLASQLKRLQMMEQSAIQSMGAHIPPGAQLGQPGQPGQMGMMPQQQQQQQQPQQQQQQAQQQQGMMMQGGNPGLQPSMNGMGSDPNFQASQQGDLAQLQQQAQQQSPFGQSSMQPPQNQGQPSGFNLAQMSNPGASMQPGAPQGAGAAGGAKRDFVGTVRNFMLQRGTPFPPQLPLSFVGPASSNLPGETKTIELQALFAAVIHSGGSQRAAQIPGFWAVIASRLGLKVGPPDGTQSAPDAVPSPGEVPDRLSSFYRDRLSAFEQFWISRMPQRQASGPAGAAASPTASGSAAPTQDPSQPPGSTPQQMPQQVQQQKQQQPPQPSQQQQQQQPQQQQPGAQDANAPGQPGVNRPNATNLPANLHQQMLQLQHLVATGRITSQQARERFVAMQQATRQMMMKQQQQQPQQQQQTPTSASADGFSAQQTQQSPFQQQPQQQQPPAGSNAVFPGMSAMPPTQASPGQGQGGMPGMPGMAQASPAANQGLPGTMPGAHPELFNDPAKLLAQQQQQAFQQAPGADQSTPDGVPLWPSQPGMGGPPSPTKSQINGAGPQTPTLGSKPESRPSKKKRKKTDSIVPTALPPAAGLDVKPPMPHMGEAANGAAAAGQPPVTASPASAGPPPQPERQLVPGTSQPIGPPAPPQKHKIEYLPMRRDVHTYGGWDLSLVESQYAPAMQSRGRPRTLRELGLVDVQALVMSLRSRLDFEVSYALNALLILSAGVGAAPSFQFGLAACEDLLDELLELLTESSFVSKDEEVSQGLDSLQAVAQPAAKRLRREGGIGSMPTYRDWITAAAEEEAELRIWRRRKVPRSRSSAGSLAGSASERSFASSSTAASSQDVLEGTISTNGVESEHERSTEKRAACALTVLTILKNFSSMPENTAFFNSTPALLQTLVKLCQSDTERVRAMACGEPVDEGDDDTPSTVFTTAEALRVRKEVVVIVSNLAGEALSLRSQSADTVRALFELLASFVFDAAAVEEIDHAAEIADLAATLPPGAAAPPVIRRTPYHADLALDALSKLALPDDNREVMGEVLPGEDIERVVDELIKMLPMTEADFKVLSTEHRLGYCERLAMCMYNLAFLAPPQVKLRLRKKPGLAGIVLRIVKKLARVTPEFSRNPFSVLCRRLVEALRLISDGQDMFGAPALLGFGLGDNNAASSLGKKQIGLLLNDEDGVVDILSTHELDGVLAEELYALIATG